MNGHDKSGGEDTTREMRASVREIFLHALEESSVERGFNRRISYERGILQVGDDLYDLATFSRLFVVSFGKAAHSGLNSLVTRLGSGAGATGIPNVPKIVASRGFNTKLANWPSFVG